MKAQELGDKIPNRYPLVEEGPLIHELAMSDDQDKAYGALLAEASEARQRRLGYLPRLFGVSAHPSLEGKESVLPPLSQQPFPKGLKLMELLAQVKGRSEKAIVFANRRLIQRWIASEILTRFEVEAPVINGMVTSSRKRLAIIDEFSDQEGFGVLVLAPRAAGVGLNITAANHVIHYTREWNPAIENQATDRVYRLGQTREVFVHALVCTSKHQERSVEQRLDALLREKRRLMDDFIVPMGGTEVGAAELLDGL